MRERRSRKTGRPPPPFRGTDDMCDPENVPQYFQISVNVLEARKLIWSNPQSATSYVMVVLGRKKHRTTVRKNQEEPVYREYLLFEMYMSIREIQRSSLWLAVMEPKCYATPRMLGEATIDLGAVWAQPNHQVYHKWAQLSLPRDPNIIGAVGFLKVDISIIFRGEVQVMPAIVCDEKVEEHILFPTGSEQQRAKYVVTIHAAFSLPSSVQAQSDRRFGKPPSTYVRVSFSGLVGKTAVQQRSTDPKYNEQISMVEMFPNINQVIRFEVCSGDICFNRVIASTELKLGVIAHDGDNGFLPVFGPSLIHMYGATNTMGGTTEDGPYHKGSLLVSIKTVVPYYQQNLRTVSVEPALPILPDNIWVQEEFCIFCPIFEMSMLDNHTIRKFTGLAMTIGEIPSSRTVDEEFVSLATELKNRKMHYTGCLEVINAKPYGYIEFRHDFPVLQLAIRLPDFRFRMYRNNIVQGIISQLEHALTEIEKRLYNFDYSAPIELTDDINRAADDAAANILKYLDIVNYSSNSTASEDCLQPYSTELDHRQLALQKEEIEKIYHQLTKRSIKDSAISICQQLSKAGTKDSLIGSRRGVKVMLAEIKILAEQLRSTIHKSPNGWPDLIIWLLNDGSRVAYTKLHLADIVYSVIPEQCGSNCGQIQTIYMKPLKCSKHMNTSGNCYCIAGKVEVMLWMSLFRQRHGFSNFMPPEYHLKHKDLEMHVKAVTMVISCKAYIYRAKLVNDSEDTLNNPYSTFVRLNALSHVKDTRLMKMTATPIWNQVLTVRKLTCTTIKRMTTNPPFALIEVYDDNLLGKTELLGRFQIQPVFDDHPKYVPKLQWYEIYKGAQKTGEILMSIHFLLVPEQLMKSTYYGTDETSFHATTLANNSETEVLESLPASLIPQSITYKVDVFWWGLREVNIARKPLVVLEIDELFMKSDIILDRKPNNNFPNNRTTQIFESPLNEDYPPNLCIRLYDSSTFGRTLFLGTNVIKNPGKYIIDWIPKNEREASLKSVSITSSDFCEVGGQMLYVKKNNKSAEDYERNCSIPPLKSLNAYHTKTKKSKWSGLFKKKNTTEEEQSLLPVYAKVNDSTNVLNKNFQQENYDNWWIRYFQSEKNENDEENEKQTSDSPDITIYDYELEHQPEFSKFKDWCSSLKFYNGKKTGIPEKDEQLQCGILKAGIAIYRWPPPKNVVAVSLNGVELDKGYFEDHPNNDSTKHLIRVYVVKAVDLPKDCSSKSNPYVIMHCGKRQLGDRMNHIMNTTDPIFGRMYEFSCVLPEDYLLTVSLYDFDIIPPDELFGTTTIDLEDRIYSKHRARVGLASEYTLSGPSKWRDSVKPSAILEELCAKNHIPPPIFPDTFSVMVNGVEYRDNTSGLLDGKSYTAIERKENICLSILHKWQTLPICGYHLVPEHVETRTLFHPDRPGVDRGKIQLWVDIFPMDANTYIPPPRDITPRKVENYELRVVVWDVQSLLVAQGNWKTADLYVKIYIGSADNAQQTDIHYNSISGEGNFNWRMVFNFSYNHVERKLINKEQGPFTEYEEYVTPILHVDLMESKEDEILGSLHLNLNSMFRGSKLVQQCTVETMETGKKINLFNIGCVRGWWPFRAIDLANGDEVPGGAVDLELTLLPQGRAVLMPVGVGRDSPAPLPEPSRTAPPEEQTKRSFRYNLIQHKGQEVLLFIVIVAVVWFVVYILYLALPSAENFIYRSIGDEIEFKWRQKKEDTKQTIVNGTMKAGAAGRHKDLIVIVTYLL